MDPLVFALIVALLAVMLIWIIRTIPARPNEGSARLWAQVLVLLLAVVLIVWKTGVLN